jgi:hypothetical protein
VRAEDAGAASGLVNAAHQLGGSLGLAILVVVFAAVGAGMLDPHVLLAHRVSAAFTAGAVMLACALVIVMLTVVRSAKSMHVAS